ncbi:MAG: hypothetical protein FJ265_05705 [Planctomycetes bacterium]|nr:hypothetical protein [Planctomycetota bacterium]
MSSAGISFGGLASGLDTQAIIRALMAVERRPITQLETKKTTLNKAKSLFGDLDGLLDKLQAAAKALKTTTDFLKMKVASDDEDVLTASAAGSAAPGTHTVRVNRLATAQIHASTGSASPTSTFGSAGEFLLTVGGHEVVVAMSDPSLESIAAAINDEASRQRLNVRAEVVDTGNAGNARYQLVVRATETGSAGAFTITAVVGEQSFTDLMAGLVGNQISAARDSEVVVNGIVVTRSTNSVTGAIAGVTLDLKSVPSPNKDVTITVSTDATETAKKVQEFVDAYNKVVDFFTDQNALDAEGKAKSPLFGDATLRSMRSALRNVVGARVTGTGNEAYQMLAQLGIKADTQGKLTFTQSKLEQALADDEQAVAAVFTDATAGIARRLEDQIDVYTDSVDGLLKTRSDGFDRLVKQTQSRIDRAEDRLERYQKQLETKYANLESLLTRLQGQGSSIPSIGSFGSSRR